MAKNQSLPARLQEKDSQGEHDLTMYEHHEKSTVLWPRPNLSNPRSINDIVWAFLRANPTLLWVVTNCVLTIGTVCGKGLCFGTGSGWRQSFTSFSVAGYSVLEVKSHQGLRFFTRGYVSSLRAALCSVSSTDGSRGLVEELIPLKPRPHAKKN